jgi:hypothetical protein
MLITKHRIRQEYSDWLQNFGWTLDFVNGWTVPASDVKLFCKLSLINKAKKTFCRVIFLSRQLANTVPIKAAI